MSAPEITIHQVTKVEIKANTIKGLSIPDFGKVQITIITNEGKVLELDLFTSDHEGFILNVAGVEHGIHFV